MLDQNAISSVGISVKMLDKISRMADMSYVSPRIVYKVHTLHACEIWSQTDQWWKCVKQ